MGEENRMEGQMLKKGSKAFFATLVAVTLIAFGSNASAGVDGTYSSNDNYTNVQQLSFQLDNGKMVADPGTLAWRVDSNGNVFVAFVQPLSINDNTYGANAIGWGKTKHSFSNLVGSDKGHFDFTNGAGQTVLSFDLDYISQSKTNKNSYTSLGVTGGDGKVQTGSASSVLQWGTSLGYDLNTLGYSQYTTDSPAATPQMDSKGNIDYSKPYLNSAAPGWDYSITYEVMISAAAFGPSGFGSVTVPYAHDSPSKFGQNTIVVVPEPSTYVAMLAVFALLLVTHAKQVTKRKVKNQTR
jgi:hypothetical protein